MANQCVVKAKSTQSKDGSAMKAVACLGSAMFQSPMTMAAPPQMMTSNVVSNSDKLRYVLDNCQQVGCGMVMTIPMDCVVTGGSQQAVTSTPAPSAVTYTQLVDGPVTTTTTTTKTQYKVEVTPQDTVVQTVTEGVSTPIAAVSATTESMPAVEVQPTNNGFVTLVQNAVMPALHQVMQPQEQQFFRPQVQYAQQQPQQLFAQQQPQQLFATAQQQPQQLFAAPQQIQQVVPQYVMSNATQQYTTTLVPQSLMASQFQMPSQGVTTQQFGPANQSVCQQYIEDLFAALSTGNELSNPVAFTKTLMSLNEEDLKMWLGERGFFDNPTQYFMGPAAIRDLIITRVQTGRIPDMPVYYSQEVVQKTLDHYDNKFSALFAEEADAEEEITKEEAKTADKSGEKTLAEVLRDFMTTSD